jgi:phosphoenolpyruvate-protein phosphotransferase (PTS system enzyme I)
MTDPIGGAVLPGTVASPGLAVGPIALQRTARIEPRAVGRRDEEEQALRAAIATAASQLCALGEAVHDEIAAHILEFQLALLEDEDLIDPILQATRAGEPADKAWATALNREIADYRAADDETFRARAADLIDLRDRVARALAPASGIRPILGQPAAIYADDELTPSRFLEIDWTRYVGAATRGGSAAGHVALLARARGTPLIVGLEAGFKTLRDGMLGVLDAEQGQLILDPTPDTLTRTRRRQSAVAAQTEANARFLDKPAVTADGERVHVFVNVDDPALLEGLDPAHCDGIGLTRTEFLFQGKELPDEEQQYQVYCRIIAWAAGRPVIVRTLDAGGDKPIAGLTVDGERNPFLGLRGLRLSLARPEVFRVQLRALARAAATGDLKIMLPMVTEPRELDAARAMLDEVVADLQASGIEAATAPLGMMIEVPAAALTAASFAADFYSIGSNDLVQYVMAASRDNPNVARLYDPGNPAVQALIRRVVEVADARGVEVSLCGDMASDPAYLPTLLSLGLRRISVTPAQLAPIKAAIAAWQPLR